jgi:hypothetical protein
MDRENTAGGRGGGLLVYAKNGLKVFKLDKVTEFDQYCKFLICNVTFYLVYRSPNSPPPPTTEVIHSLENLLKSVNKNSVMIGDFNLPDVDWMEGGQQQCETQVAH